MNKNICTTREPVTATTLSKSDGQAYPQRDAVQNSTRPQVAPGRGRENIMVAD